jgi:hypothetical protein
VGAFGEERVEAFILADNPDAIRLNELIVDFADRVVDGNPALKFAGG